MVGIVDGEERLDLDYFDDSRAQVDMNVAYTAKGEFVEIQGSAENGGGFDRAAMDRLRLILARCRAGQNKLMDLQRKALATSS